MTVQEYTVTLVVESCCSCGVRFGLDSEHEEILRRKKSTFYCPNGHSLHYPGESDHSKAERLARDLAAARDREATLRAENQKRLRLQRAAEGKTRAIKRRVSAGVCPCCTRSFQNLARHMESQHPGFGATEERG